MSNRILYRVAAVTLVTGLLSLGSLSSGEAQPTPAPGDWVVPRTGWGVPDLQGIWTNATLTPIERPDSLVGKTVLTAEEAADLETRSAERRVASDRFIAGEVGAYNQFWMDVRSRGVEERDRRPAHVADRRPAGREDPMGPRGTTAPRARLDEIRRGTVRFLGGRRHRRALPHGWAAARAVAGLQHELPHPAVAGVGGGPQRDVSRVSVDSGRRPGARAARDRSAAR